jgi:hypothetical protein
MSNRLRWSWRLLFCLVGLANAAGCAQWNIGKSFSLPTPWEEKPGTPEKIVAVWTDTVLNRTGAAPQRGFGARLMFFEAKKEKPIKVDGTLVVYAFLEDGRDPNNVKPDRKYVFTAEQLPSHYSKSTLGHSYSIWVPWDEVGGTQKEISLAVRFEPKKGAVVVGDLARQVLPGKSPAGVAANPAAGGNCPPASSPAACQNQNQKPSDGAAAAVPTNPTGAQLVSYNAALPPANEALSESAARRIQTVTIPIPSSMAAHTPLTTDPAPQARPTTSVNRLPATSAPASLPNSPPRSRFEPGTRRAPAEPLARQVTDRGPWPPRPEGSPFVPAVPPGSASDDGSPTNPPAAGLSQR